MPADELGRGVGGGDGAARSTGDCLLASSERAALNCARVRAEESMRSGRR